MYTIATLEKVKKEKNLGLKFNRYEQIILKEKQSKTQN